MSRAESMDKRDSFDEREFQGADFNSAADFAVLCMLNPELAQEQLEAEKRFNEAMEKLKKEAQAKEKKEPE